MVKIVGPQRVDSAAAFGERSSQTGVLPLVLSDDEDPATAAGLTSEPLRKGYHLLPAVRGDLLAKLGRVDEARAEFERAASLTRNSRERKLLLDRAKASRSRLRIVE